MTQAQVTRETRKGRLVGTSPEGAFPSLERADSLASQAYTLMRDRIATGGLLPGERLTERGLALLLGVSPTPVREALRRLEQEGLVTRTSSRTLTVVEHSEESLQELLYAEAVLRAASARFATRKISAEDISRLERTVDHLVALAPEASAEDILAVAESFDAILHRAAGNSSLDALIGSAGVFSRSRRIQAIRVLRDRYPATGLLRIEAHRAIVAALRDRDPDRVEQAVRSQLTDSQHILLSDLESPQA